MVPSRPAALPASSPNCGVAVRLAPTRPSLRTNLMMPSDHRSDIRETPCSLQHAHQTKTIPHVTVRVPIHAHPGGRDGALASLSAGWAWSGP